MLQQIIRIQQKFYVPVFSIAYQFLLQACGPLHGTLVHMHLPKDEKKMEGFISTFSLARSVFVDPKVLVAIDDGSFVNDACATPNRDQLKALEEVVQKKAKFICNPSKLDGICDYLEPQVFEFDRRNNFDELQRKIDSTSCSQSTLSPDCLTLLLHLKAYSIMHQQPVISIDYYLSVASQFGFVNNEQAISVLCKFQKLWLLFRPNDEHLGKFIFIDFQWLVDCFDEVFTPSINSESNLDQSWDLMQSEAKIDGLLFDHLKAKTPRVCGIDLPPEWLILLAQHGCLLTLADENHKLKAYCPILVPLEASRISNGLQKDNSMLSVYVLPSSNHLPHPLYIARLLTNLCNRQCLQLERFVSQSSAIFIYKHIYNIIVNISSWHGYIRIKLYANNGTVINDSRKHIIACDLLDIISSADLELHKLFIPEPHNSRSSASQLKRHFTCFECTYTEKHLTICDLDRKEVSCLKTKKTKPFNRLPYSQLFWIQVIF